MENLESTVTQEAANRGFFGRMQDKVSDYASRAGQKARTAAAIATVLAGGFLGSQKAEGATIDPLTLVNTNTSYDQAIADPHGGASGNIAGADFVSSIDSFVILYDSGRVDFYQDSAAPIASTPYKSWGSLGTTGISAIDPKYGGELAITDNSGIGLYDLDGNLLSNLTTDISDITDISYDGVNDQIFLSRDNNTVTLNADGTTDFAVGAGPDEVEYITLTEDGNGNPIDDLLQTGAGFYRVDDTTGQLMGSALNTNMVGGEGVAYSPNHILSTVEGGFFVYNNQQHAFQQFQDTTTVPEPSALIMGLVGLAGIAAGRTGRKQYQRMDC